MDKTIWFVHDAWYTSLQLLECDVGVEVCLCVDLMVDLLALLLLVSLMLDLIQWCDGAG